MGAALPPHELLRRLDTDAPARGRTMRRTRSDSVLDNPELAWAPFEPSASAPWDRAAVAHLHRRAGFSAPWGVLARDLELGPGASVDRLLEGEEASADGRSAETFQREQDALATRFGGAGNDLRRLQAVWLMRMVFTPHPLRERLTLFWHGHFATSNAKVRNANLMRRQNDLLRKHALGRFGDLLAAMSRDPAMLVWLDSASNRKAHPNENYAREVMELFALGRGQYTEKDVQEAARAFTGSFVQGDVYREVISQHDDGLKTILGRTGAFRGEDVTSILLEQPACAEFLCRKLYRLFVSEVDDPPAPLLAPLARGFRESGYDVRVPVRTILASRLFFSPEIRARRVKSPVELVVGTVRALEILKPTVSPEAMAQAAERMGQALFAPPSVAGWGGGPAWLNTTTSLARANFVLGLTADSQRFKPGELAERHGATADPVRFFSELLLPLPPDEGVRSRLSGSPREVASLILNTPEYQLA